MTENELFRVNVEREVPLTAVKVQNVGEGQQML